VACWGAAELMRREFDLPITAITGPATDNEVGQVYITAELGLPAHNARRDASGLLGVVRGSLAEWHARTNAAAGPAAEGSLRAAAPVLATATAR